jgi:hypothetical protein
MACFTCQNNGALSEVTLVAVGSHRRPETSCTYPHDIRFSGLVCERTGIEQRGENVLKGCINQRGGGLVLPYPGRDT